MHFDAKGKKQEVGHCKFWIAALTLLHIRDFNSLLLPEESSILLQRFLLAHVRQILTVTAYNIYFYSKYYKINLLCERETWCATVSFRICKIFLCQPLSTMSSAFYCDLQRKMALSHSSRRFVQRCCLMTRLLHSRIHCR